MKSLIKFLFVKYTIEKLKMKVYDPVNNYNHVEDTAIFQQCPTTNIRSDMLIADYEKIIQ